MIYIIWLFFLKVDTSKKTNKSSLRPEQHSNKHLGGYLAGLLEGDGSIIVPKTVRNQKGKLLYPIVKFAFVKKDEPLAVKIKETLGGGTIVHAKNNGHIDLLFQDITSIQKIAVLLNGNMRTPKLEALYRLIDWLNAKQPEQLNITKLELDHSSIGSNPWLSGFIESDGNFYCGFDLNDKGIAGTVKTYMRISQNQTYRSRYDLPNDSNSNLRVMEEIKTFLEIKNVNNIKRVKSTYIEIGYEVRTTKKESCNILIDYLTIYPLFSSKHLDFSDWYKTHKIRLSRKYKTLEGTSKLIALKNSMNTKRTQFNWDSLEKFYSLT